LALVRFVLQKSFAQVGFGSFSQFLGSLVGLARSDKTTASGHELSHLQIVVNNNETRMAAFEISAKNRKNRENNKREQARPKEINHLAKASASRPRARRYPRPERRLARRAAAVARAQ
jgi:hypothetical protein